MQLCAFFSPARDVRCAAVARKKRGPRGEKRRGGRKIVYTGDTRTFKGFAKFAAGADLLVHDATLDDELAEKAEEDGHSTPSQAAENAKKGKVKQLILTHISARYDDTSALLEQAQKVAH